MCKRGDQQGFPQGWFSRVVQGAKENLEDQGWRIFHASAKKRVLSNYQKRSAELEEEEEEVYREYPATPQSYLRESVS